jgi:oligoribonuclease
MKKARLLWLDMEMTGLDPEKDRVLELAVIATDWQLREIATMTAVVQQPLAATLMHGEFWEKNAALRRTLLAENETEGQATEQVERKLVKFVKEYFPVGDARLPIYIAGNSVHQDRRFLRRYFPEVDELFHYRLLDVSSFKIIFNHRYHQKIQKPEVHRALDDIRGSMAELMKYLEWTEQGVKKGQTDGNE